MVRRYVIEYEVDVRDKVKQKRAEFLRVAGRFWEHAVPVPKFKYELDAGDNDKAKKIARVIEKMIRKGVKMKKIRQIIKEVR